MEIKIKNKNISVEKKKLPYCWICNDQGLVFYTKRYNGIDYDYAYRCKCRLGQSASQSIKPVPDELIDKLAEGNFDKLRCVYPELVMGLA